MPDRQHAHTCAPGVVPPRLPGATISPRSGTVSLGLVVISVVLVATTMTLLFNEGTLEHRAELRNQLTVALLSINLALCVALLTTMWSVRTRIINPLSDLVQRVRSRQPGADESAESFPRVQGEVGELTDAINDLLKLSHASQNRFMTLVNALAEGVVMQDTSDRILACNPAAQRILGLSREQLMGLRSVDPRWSACDERGNAIAGENHPTMVSLRTGIPQRNVIMQVSRPDASRVWLRVNCEFVRDVHGETLGVVASFADITAEREALTRLRESEWRFRALAEGTDIVLWEFDPEDGRFTYVSPQAERWGYPIGQWHERGFWERSLHPDDREAAVEVCKQETMAGRNHRFSYRMFKADGSIVWVDDFVTIHSNPDGTRLLRGVLVDVSEMIKLKERAEESSRAKSEFLANMSHEIRTPLTAILGFADLLHEDGDIRRAPDHRLEHIETIRAAGQHLLGLINDILDLSKIEAGRMTVEQVECRPAEMLAEIASLYQVHAAQKNLALTLELATPIPEAIITDPTRFRQIVMNLLGNACKFTSSGTISCIAAAASVNGKPVFRVDVRDSGAGIDAHGIARLFSPFTQADASTTRRFGGTGLGLTICRRLAMLMGGNVTLVSSHVGQGSTFRVEVPLVAHAGCPLVTSFDAVRHRAAVHGDSSIAQLSGRILLAEDGPDNQRLIAFHLRKAGAEVVIADNGKIALDMLAAAAGAGQPFDLLLTDMQMPEMDGYTLASTLRARGSVLPIIAITAHAMAGDRQRCLAAGCNDYTSKPINRQALVATCAEWMNRAAAESSAT